MAPLGRLIVAVSMAVIVALPVRAAPQAGLDELLDALRVEDTVAIMREEGLRYGEGLATEMLPDVNPDSWARVISRIYDTGKMTAVVKAEFAEAIAGTDLDPLVAFFTSELGREIISLELSAREAFLDADTEAAAMQAWEQARDTATEKLGQVEIIIADSDLVDYNVMGALNANLMFYRGLADGGAIEMSEEEMLTDVWAQEDSVRSDSEGWLGSFLLMAYRPLAADDLEAYAAMYRTAEGKALNAAIFAAYDRMYEEISYLLGQAVAQQMQSEEL